MGGVYGRLVRGEGAVLVANGLGVRVVNSDVSRPEREVVGVGSGEMGVGRACWGRERGCEEVSWVFPLGLVHFRVFLVVFFGLFNGRWDGVLVVCIWLCVCARVGNMLPFFYFFLFWVIFFFLFWLFK